MTTITRYRARYRVRHGSLLKCCVQTLDDKMLLQDDEPREGERATCWYCEGGMMYRDHAWEWFRSRDDDLVPRN